MCLCHHRSPVARDSSRAFASLSTFNFGLLTSFSPTLSHTSEKSPASSKYCHTSKTPSRNSFTIRTSETPLPQLLYNPHLQAPLGSAGNKGLITPLESALTKNSPVTSLESALTKGGGWGVPTQQTPNSYSEAPRGRKYWVPLTGSWRRRRRSWRSSLRSTKSMSEVLMTRRSEAA